MNTNTSIHPILYIDDEEDNLTVFYSTFRRNYEIHLATSGQEGMEIMKQHNVHLVIADQRMPKMTGIEFLEKIILEYPDCIRMVLTGFSDVEAIIQAINKGRVYRYITKPWNKDDLKITIDHALETYNLKQQNRKLFTDLKEANETLEKKVIERTKKIESQRKELTDSLHYARRIQNALLPPGEELDKLLPSYFILNKPRNIVSGDYYWLAQKDNKVIVAVADCTGHGVPGAFMSILGVAYLNGILNQTVAIRANEILNQLRGQVIKSLRQTGKADEARDGMEIALCVVDFRKKKLQYSGAFRPLYLIRNNELKEFKGDSMPIGIYNDEDISFSNEELNFKEDDIIYLFSDGYVDQLGGPNRKTFKSMKFKQLLINIHQKPLHEQKGILEKEYEEWRHGIEQIDDIMVMGIRFTRV
ncbi:MAG: SpoIIE family protein phosphatase [Bacteroides sp.]|nr:SpoIIE family protein phosphatase [Bacteroides sp.]